MVWYISLKGQHDYISHIISNMLHIRDPFFKIKKYLQII